MPRSSTTILLPIVFFAHSFPAAAAIQTVFQPVQGILSDRSAVVLSGDRYERQTYDVLGASAIFQGQLFDAEGNYLMPEGDNWRYEIRQLTGTSTDGPVTRASATVTYIGGEDNCWSFGVCDTLGSVRIMFGAQCPEEERFDVRLFHNGVLVGSKELRPTRFVPEFLRFFVAPQEIQPQIPAIQDVPSRVRDPRKAQISAIIEDDLGCFQRIEDARVRFTNTITASDPDLPHGHVHFSDEDIGTGNYQGVAGFPFELIDDGNAETATIVQGYTNDRGAFGATYESGELGVTELVTASVLREKTDDDPEVGGDDKAEELRIRVPGLVEIDPAAISAIREDGGGCPKHDPLPDWLTPGSLERLAATTTAYEGVTGRRLSLNDGSLPFGGVIENEGGGGRTSRCHSSHRIGIDIDLNARDGGDGSSTGRTLLRCPRTRIPSCDALDPSVEELKQRCNIGTVQMEDGGEDFLICMVDDLFDKRGGRRIPSEGIHYRFPD